MAAGWHRGLPLGYGFGPAGKYLDRDGFPVIGANFPLWNGPERRNIHEQPDNIEYSNGWHRSNDFLRTSRPLKNVTSKKYLVRPWDGKRPGQWGMLKDIIKGEGPDYFVASVADPRHFWDEMPDRATWSGWGGWDYDENMIWKWHPWGVDSHIGATRSGAKHDGLRYDWAKRKYKKNPRGYTDVQWGPNAKRDETSPNHVRDREGMWWRSGQEWLY